MSIRGITMALARAGHPTAMKVMDGWEPGWRDNPVYKPFFTGRWEGDVFIPDPPVVGRPEGVSVMSRAFMAAMARASHPTVIAAIDVPFRGRS